MKAKCEGYPQRRYFCRRSRYSGQIRSAADAGLFCFCTERNHRENLTCLPLSTSTRSACGPPLASSRAQAGRSPDGSSGGSSPISERKGEREVASARFCTCRSECRALRGCCEGEARGDIYRGSAWGRKNRPKKDSSWDSRTALEKFRSASFAVPPWTEYRTPT